MVYTCDMLLWQAHALRVRDYETLAQACGGKWWRIFTEVWLVILMLGTLLGSVVQARFPAPYQAVLGPWSCCRLSTPMNE